MKTIDLQNTKSIDEMFVEYGFTVERNSNQYELLYSESDTIYDVVSDCYADNDDEAYRILGHKALEYIDTNNLSPLPKKVDVDAKSDEYVVYALSLFLRDETLEDCPIKVVSREDIDGEEAELVHFTFGDSEESCVAVVYNDGTVYAPYDWQMPEWDEDGWTIDKTEWMNCNFIPCVNLNGMPRMI